MIEVHLLGRQRNNCWVGSGTIVGAAMEQLLGRQLNNCWDGNGTIVGAAMEQLLGRQFNCRPNWSKNVGCVKRIFKFFSTDLSSVARIAHVLFDSLHWHPAPRRRA